MNALYIVVVCNVQCLQLETLFERVHVGNGLLQRSDSCTSVASVRTCSEVQLNLLEPKRAMNLDMCCIDSNA